MYTAREQKIIEKLKTILVKSPSHDLKDAERVVRNSLTLWQMYSGNREIIVPACLLSDIGRHYGLKGQEHAEKSAEIAEGILSNCGYEDWEIEKIQQAILAHETAEFISQEDKIVYDADKLDGFGILGIARILMYCGERRLSLDDAVRKMKIDMKERMKKLNFPYSQKNAEEKYQEVKRFLKELERSL